MGERLIKLIASDGIYNEIFKFLNWGVAKDHICIYLKTTIFER